MDLFVKPFIRSVFKIEQTDTIMFRILLSRSIKERKGRIKVRNSLRHQCAPRTPRNASADVGS